MEKRKESLSTFSKKMAENAEQYSGHMCWMLTNDRNQNMIVIWDEHDPVIPYDANAKEISVYFPESVDDYMEIVDIVKSRKRALPSCGCWDTIERFCINRIESIQAVEEITAIFLGKNETENKYA